MAASTIIAEVGSGNLAPHQFFLPGVALPLITIGYGLPLLLLRELALARGVGLFGLFLFGCAYGFINEGLLAKTMFRETGVPIPSFDRYGVFAGINAPWTALIAPWHAINSLLGPLALTCWLFPAAQARPWLTRRWFWGLAALEALACTGIFFTAQPGQSAGALPHFLFAVLAFAALVALGLVAPKAPALAPPAPARRRLLGWGLGLFLALPLTPFALAEGKVPLIVYAAYLAALAGAVAFVLRRRGAVSAKALLLVALGNQGAESLWLVLGAGSRGDIERVGVALVTLGLVLLLARRASPRSG